MFFFLQEIEDFINFIFCRVLDPHFGNLDPDSIIEKNHYGVPKKKVIENMYASKKQNKKRTWYRGHYDVISLGHDGVHKVALCNLGYPAAATPFGYSAFALNFTFLYCSV